MRPLLGRLRLAGGVASFVLCAGCMSWTPGWKLDVPASSDTDPGVEESIEAANVSFRQASSASELARVRSDLERLLARSPQSLRGLLTAAHLELLQGAAYDKRRSAKAASYRRGIQYAERAMATDPGFAERVRSGATVEEAASTLGPEHAKAMLLWVTGVSYYFKECLSGLGHMVNFRWMLQTSGVLEHLMEVAPEIEHGAVPFSLGIYYLALPRSAGGDMVRAGELMEKAVAQSSSTLLPHWGRAKYYWSKLGDREAFRSDLEWVLAQDPRAGEGSYAWNLYFQNDARAMLDQIDEIF